MNNSTPISLRSLPSADEARGILPQRLAARPRIPRATLDDVPTQPPIPSNPPRAPVDRRDGGDVESAPGPPDTRQRIEIGPDIHRVVDEAEGALANLRPRVYARAARLVTVHRVDGGVGRGDDGPLEAVALTSAALTDLLTRAADWVSARKADGSFAYKGQRVLPPSQAVRALMDRREWPQLPRLRGIVEAPTVRRDGTILATPGFDPSTGLLFDPHGRSFPPVPERPSGDEVGRAVAALRKPFLEFQWQQGDDVDIPVVTALILTFVARPAILGPVPCFAFDSTTRGSGKGLSAETAVIAATGRRPPVTVLSGEQEEQRKHLLAHALEGHRAVQLDNITQPLGGPVLSAAVTAGEVRDRILGVSRTATAPLDCVFVATGNNLRFFGDFDRRVLVARQEPTVERPEDRQPPGGFRYPDLRAYATRKHPKLVTAALTIIRGWDIAGRPPHGLTPFGSFEAWDGLVRAASLWAGLGDPLRCRARVKAFADDDVERIRALHEAWEESFGSRTATAMDAVDAAGERPRLRSALALLDSRGSPDRPNLQSIGHSLHSIAGRIVRGRRLERVGTKSPARLRVVPVKTAECAESPRLRSAGDGR